MSGGETPVDPLFPLGECVFVLLSAWCTLSRGAPQWDFIPRTGRRMVFEGGRTPIGEWSRLSRLGFLFGMDALKKTRQQGSSFKYCFLIYFFRFLKFSCFGRHNAGSPPAW